MQIIEPTGTVIELTALSLRAQVAHRLRQMLIDGRIEPGAKLNERELAAALSTRAQPVSRTPLREAIRMLAAEGLVELLPNRGAIAVRLSEADVMHTFELVAGLEGLSGELAAARITAPELSELRARHFEMLAAFERRSLPAYYALNAKIHTLINLAAKNPALSATYAQVNARLQALRFRTNQDEEKWQAAIKEHSHMLDALAARDTAGLRGILTAHVLRKRDVVIAQLREAAREQRA